MLLARSAPQCARVRDSPPRPVYGSNNWYYAYGSDTSAERSFATHNYLGGTCPVHIANRPYCVIDMGWHKALKVRGLREQTSAAYPDMPGLAQKMVASRCAARLWTRPTLTVETVAKPWRLAARATGRKAT